MNCEQACMPSEFKEVGTGVDILRNVPWMYEFVISDGRRLRNVFELIDALDFMNDGTFGYHVNDSKNDFSSWLRNVFGDNNLANDILHLKDKMEMQRIIMKHTIRKMLDLCYK